MNRAKIIVGTRGSELACAQTDLMIQQWRQARSNVTIERQIIKTRGDDPAAVLDEPAGRKGLFTGELERALIEQEIDLAVHSAKDLPSNLAESTTMAAVLERASIDDVLITKTANGLESLRQKAVVATGSVRRRHQLLWKRPDIEVVNLRGNVPTRLRKLIETNWDAIILARAGLERLGIQLKDGTFLFEEKKLFAAIMPPEIFLPAGGQGVIAIQCRADDRELRSLLKDIDHRETHLCLRAEREFLRLLNADCNQPIGVLATTDESIMTVRAQIFDRDKNEPRMATIEGAATDPERLAAELFEKLQV